MFEKSKHEEERLKKQIVELQDALKLEIDKSVRLEDDIKELTFSAKHMKETVELAHERKIIQLQRDMEKALIQSDLTRVEAVSRLEVYQKTDTRADANTIKDMVKQLIDSIGKQNVNIVK